MKAIKCKYCNTLFIPKTKRQFICDSKECKKAHARYYRNKTLDRGKFKNVMAKWRAENRAKAILSNINTRNNIDIDEEWIQERLDRGVCEVTGIKFETTAYGTKPKGFNHYPWTPSIDKIVPEKGYTKENCRMVVWAYNRAKGLWDDITMKKLAEGMYNGLVK